jgi:hypothetical protein
LIEERESLLEMEELSKDEDLVEVSKDEREMLRERKASLASSSMARFMMRERNRLMDEGISTCFNNIWRLRWCSLRDMSLTSCNSCKDKDMVLLLPWRWVVILLRAMLLVMRNLFALIVGDLMGEICELRE